MIRDKKVNKTNIFLPCLLVVHNSKRDTEVDTTTKLGVFEVPVVSFNSEFSPLNEPLLLIILRFKLILKDTVVSL